VLPEPFGVRAGAGNAGDRLAVVEFGVQVAALVLGGLGAGVAPGG
jgi:hypothetical protein